MARLGLASEASRSYNGAVTEQATRRRVLKWIVGGAATAGLSAFGGLGYAVRIEPHWLTLERVEVPIPSLPTHLDGFIIVQLSDLHRGPTVPQEDVTQAVNVALRQEADLIVSTGDYVYRSAEYSAACARALAPLQAPYGVYAVLGNHDHWTDPDAVAEALAAAGIEVMRNTAREVAEGLWIAAVDDVWEEQDDLDRALGNVPASATVVLMAHEPDYADAAAADGRVDLQLSGHSHGGQVRLPLIGPPITPYLAEKYRAGLYRVGGMWLYVNRGVGLVSPAVRFNCRPEVTLLTLRRPVT